MTNRETHRSLPETWKFFDPSEFGLGDEVVFHNPDTNRWERGRLATNPPIIDRDNRRIFLENTGTGGIELRIPPKKVDQEVLDKTVKISIEDKVGDHTLVDYEVQRDSNNERVWNIGPDGEIEVTLVPIGGGRNRKEISNVNLETLKNYQEVEEVEDQIDVRLSQLVNQVNNLNNIRRKELLAKLVDLDKQVHKLVEQTGHFDELGDLDPDQIKSMSTRIKELRRVAEDGAREIEATLRKVNTEIGNRGVGDAGKKRVATGMNSRIDKMQADNEKAFLDWQANQEIALKHADWQANEDLRLLEAQAYQNAIQNNNPSPAAAPAAGGNPAGGNQRGGGNNAPKPTVRERQPEPARPNPNLLNQPNGSRDKAMNAFRVLEVLAFNAIQPPHDADPAFQPHREIIDEVGRRLQERKRNEGVMGDYEPRELEEKVSGEVFLQVLEEWNQREVRVEMDFDFAKEQGLLKTKINELLTEAEKLSMGNLADSLRANLDLLNSYTKGGDVETQLANMWGDVGHIEIELFREKNRTTGRSEQEKNIDVDIPHTVLMDIFMDRQQEVYNVMREAYTNQGGNTRAALEAALRRIFEPSPTQTGPRVNGNLQANEAMIARLRQYGIKDWRHFKKLWDEKLAPRAAVMMHEWARDDVRNEAARNSSALDKVWALKGQIAARVGLNLALVGGGALAVGAAVGSGGLGAAVLGAATGGVVRALLQKFVFGSEKIEKRKEDILKELAERQEQEAINNLLARRFGRAHANNPDFAQDTLRMFSSLLSQAAREASAEFVGKDDQVKAVGLSADSRRLYIQAIKDVENSGEVVTEKIKLATAAAIKRLQERSVSSIEEASHGDPMIIRILDGVMAGYSGREASKANYGVKGAATTVALGATVGAAFYANQGWARATLGAIGGGAAGYHMTEVAFSKFEMNTARGAVERLYDRSAELMENILRDREVGLAINQANLVEATTNIQRLNRLLHGRADTTADQRIAQLLNTPNERRLRAEIENLVYQSYRRGLFVQRPLGDLEAHSEAAIREDRVTIADKGNDWFRRNGTKALGAVAGAALGAGAAWLGGFAAKELKELAGIKPPVDMPQSHAPKGAGAARAAETVVATKAVSEIGGGHLETAHPVEAAGSAHRHEAGLVSIKNPESVHNVSQWRHQIMEQMGYKFHGNKIDHALRFHEGAKIELVGADGNTLDTFTFKHGDSTWRALDHLDNKAAVLIKNGEMPNIKIVGVEDGKVEIMNHYKVESHTGGKTVMADSKVAVVKPLETPHTVKGLGPDNFKDAPLASGKLSDQNLRHADHWSESGDVIKGKDGNLYSVMYPDSDNVLVTGHAQDIPGHHIRYVDVHRHIYDGQGKYLGDAEKFGAKVNAVETSAKGTTSGGGAGGSKSESVSDKIKWSEGKAISKTEIANLNNLLYGDRSGGGGAPATETLVSAKAGASAAEIPTAKSAGVAEAAGTAKAESGSAVAESSPNTTVDASKDIPPAFKPQYTEWAEVKHNFKLSFNNDLDIALEDKANLMPRFLDKVELTFKQHPELLKDADIQKVLDSTSLTAGDKLNNLAGVMADKHLILFTKEEQLIFGDMDEIPADSEDFEKFNIKSTKGEYEVAVAKGNGAHVAVYKHLGTGSIYIESDPTKLFTRTSVGNVLRPSNT